MHAPAGLPALSAEVSDAEIGMVEVEVTMRQDELLCGSEAPRVVHGDPVFVARDDILLDSDGVRTQYHHHASCRFRVWVCPRWSHDSGHE